MKQKNIELTNRIIEHVRNNMPVVCSNGVSFSLEDLKVTIPESNFDIENQLKMKYTKDGSTEGILGGKFIVRDIHGNTISSSRLNKLFAFPVFTERGTFIVNGIEKNLISQMRLKPGSYTTKEDEKNEVKTQLMFSRGKKVGGYMPQIIFTYNVSENTFKVNLKSFKSVEFNILNFLTLLGFNDMEIKRSLGDNEIADSLIHKYTSKRMAKSMSDLYSIFYPSGRHPEGGILNDSISRQLIYDYFKDNAIFGSGAPVVSSNLSVQNTSYLTKDIISKAVKKTVSVSSGLAKEDVKDDLKYKDVYNDVDLIFECFENDFEKYVTETKNKIETSKTGTPPASFLKPVDNFSTKSSLKQLISSELSNVSEQTNPLLIETMSRKLTQLGPKGMSSDAARNQDSARNLFQSSMNRIDPIQTPESSNIGFTQHLAEGAIVKEKTIYSDFYQVSMGEAKISDSNKISFSPTEEENHIIAYNDSRYVKREGGKFIFTEDVVPGRYMGKEDEFPVSKVEFIDVSPKSVLGITANMIPFVSHDDGPRALMGTNMQTQAINLVTKEAPLVSVVADTDTGKTYEEKIAEQYCGPVKSTVNGIVQQITDSQIIILGADKSTHKFQYHKYYPLNQSFVNNELRVKVGDKVQEGQLLAEGWQTKDGKLAIGVNARVGFIPFKGYNYEDSVTISRSFAERVRSEEVEDIEILIRKDEMGGRGSKIKRELMAKSVSAALSKFDEDGIIKTGEYVKAGSELVGTLKLIKKEDSGVTSLDLARMQGKGSYTKYSGKMIPAGSYVEGKIVRITVIENPDSSHKQKIVFTVVNDKPLKPGDKISGRHGNKGTIGKILPDEEMPVAEDGKPLDLMFSPLAVPSRKNPGQILEVNAGLIAEKTGKPFHVNNFDHNEKDRVLKELKAIGYEDGKMKVTLKERDENNNIVDVPVENKVTVGNMYILKLKHKVDDKIQGRSNTETYLTNKELMPAKVVGSAQGEKGNPQRLGEMEMRALQGHGAVWNILESSTIKADGGGDRNTRMAIFSALATGNLDSADLKVPATPQTVRLLSDNLKVLGLNTKPMHNGKEVGLDKPYDSIGLIPLNQEEFIKKVGADKEVNAIGQFNTRQLYGATPEEQAKNKNKKNKEDKKKDSLFVKGGVWDPNIFGEDHDDQATRSNWGYIKLAIPSPNPMLMENASYNPYTLLSGLKKEEVLDLVNGKKAIVSTPDELLKSMLKNPDMPKSRIEMYKNSIINGMNEAGFKPGDIVEVSKIDKLLEQGVKIPCKTGGSALEHILSSVDVDKELEVTKSQLQTAQGKDVDFLYKKTRSLEMLKNNGLKPTDLLVKYVPVAPKYLRPVQVDVESRSARVNDLNKLYENIIRANENSKDSANLKEDGSIDSTNSGIPTKDLGQRSASVYNSLKMLTGHTVAYDRLTKKPLQSVPETLGGKYGTIRHQMLGKRDDFSGRSVIGVDPELGLNEVGLPLDIAKQIYKPFIMKELINRGLCSPNEHSAYRKLESLDEDVKKVIRDVAADRPVLLNRAPSLHKLSFQALKPVIKDYEDGSAVRNIQLNPLVVTPFNADFDGDTMSVHVPITEMAKDEAKKLMMPYKNLINPTDGKMVIEIRHEMLLGIYQITCDFNKPEGKAMNYNDYKSLERDYLLGKIGRRQLVKVPISPTPVIAGQALFNWLIPDKLSHYRVFNQAWGKKQVTQLLANIYKDAEKSEWKLMSEIEISNLMDKMKSLGFNASTRSGVSIGSGDFVQLKEIKNTLDKANAKGATIEEWQKVEKEIEDKIENGLLDSENPFNVMMASGARANKGQVRRMIATVGVGMDVSKELKAPIKESFFDGLSPQSYLRLGYDSRKGIYDRSVSTAAPGALTREVWSATQDLTVKENDCHTKEFINLKKSEQTIKGRFAGDKIIGKDGKVICKKGELITYDIYNTIYKDDSIDYVPVRSPLRCKTPHGVCQKCYGAVPGTMQLVKIGTAIGVIASQAMGEPVTQMTMNTFHTGGANSAATLGLPRIKQILSLGSDKNNGAVISDVAGEVTNITSDMLGNTIVEVGKKKFVIKKKIDGSVPMVKVKVGDFVKQGDFITVGDTEDIQILSNDNTTKIVLTNADPKKLFKQKEKAIGQQEALNYTRDYLTETMQYAFKNSNAYMDRRHAETVISKLTSLAKITDAGDSNYLKGQDVEVKELERWNAENVNMIAAKSIPVTQPNQLIGRVSATNVLGKNANTIIPKGAIIDQGHISELIANGINGVKVIPNPIKYEVILAGKDSVWSKGHDNWVSNLGGKAVNEQLTRAATLGQVDKLEDPRARQILGKPLMIGEGASLPKKILDGMTSSMKNFFNHERINEVIKQNKK